MAERAKLVEGVGWVPGEEPEQYPTEPEVDMGQLESRSSSERLGLLNAEKPRKRRKKK